MTRDISDLDKATSKRLAQLNAMPVDTAALERRLAGLTQAKAGGRAHRFTKRRVLRVASALAAVIAISVMVTLTILTDSSTAVAGPIELSQLHRSLVSGQIDMPIAGSMQEANLQVSTQLRSGPALPGFDGREVQSCCLADVKGTMRAVTLMTVDSQPVTLVIAEGSDFAHSMGQAITVDNQTLMTHEMNGIRMVMKNRGDLWLCVMGHLPAERLARVAAEIRM